MTTLTSAVKKKITDDWHSALPELGIYKPMWLLRRCGPLLTGVCLCRDSSGREYLPTTHIHCLAHPWDAIHLGLAQSLYTPRTHAENWISVKWHERHWRDAAERLSRQSLLPLTGPISLDQLERAFREVPLRHDALENRSTNTYRDWLLTLAWAGRLSDARMLLAEAMRDIATWPSYIIARQGGLEAWLDKMERLLSDPDKLRRTTEEELVKHAADKLPSVDVTTWLA